MKKRILALLLALAMILPMMPTGVTAADPATQEPHMHCICGKHDCSDASHKGQVEFIAWTSKNALPGASEVGKYYYLADNVETNAAVSLTSGTYTLCLNGKTVTNKASDQRIFRVATATLNITDCKGKVDADGNYTSGTLTGGKKSCVSLYGGTKENTVFNLYGGTITGNSTADMGGGVYVQHATFNMYGGKISGNTAQLGASTASAATMGHGGAIGFYATAANPAEFHMYGGEISGNTAKARADGTIGANGGAIYANYAGVTIEIKDGVIKNNTAEKGTTTANGNGGGIYVANGAVLKTEGGKITGNNGAREGGAVRLAGGTHTLKDVEISSNTAGYGSAINLSNSATVTLDGATITGNTATTDFGAIYIPNGGSKLIVKNNVQIKDNLQGTTNKIPANVYLRNVGSVAVVTVDGLADTATIGVTLSADRLSANVMQVATCAANEDCASKFVSDNAIYTTVQNGTQVNMILGHSHCVCNGAVTNHTHTATNFKPWTSTTSLPTEGSWYLTENVELGTNHQLADTNLTLCLNGNSITVKSTAATGNRVFRISKNVTLNITDCAATPGKLTGGKNSAIGFYEDASKSVLNFYNGEITGNTASDAGGAVLLQSGATFNMYGGKITGNKVEAQLKADGTPTNTILSGGAVAVLGTSKFYMFGGEISGNEAKSVTYQKNGVNTTVGGNGGAIYTEGTVEITGGKITGNTGAREGGAIRVKGGTVQLKNVEIAGNTGGYASAVYIDNSGKVTADGATITGNTATTDYGAIALPNGGSKLIVKNNVQIKDNLQGKTNKIPANVYLRNVGSVATVTVEGLAATAKIGVTLSADRLSANVMQVATCAANEDCASKFVSDNAIYTTVQNGTQVSLQSLHQHKLCNDDGCTEHTAVAFQSWTSTTSLPSSGNWYLTKDVTLSDNHPLANANLTLCLNGHTIKIEKTGTTGNRVFRISKNATLNITDCAATPGKITGGKSSAIGFYDDASNSVLNFYNGEITGNTTNSAGGAVLVQNGATFNMHGGKITGNKVVPQLKADGTPENTIGGGAVAVLGATSKFYMRGGEISGNEAQSITYEKDGKDTTVGGAGGAIYTTGTVEITGGKITGNTGEREGGAIRVSGGTVLLKDVAITGNTGGYASAVYIDNSGKVTVEDATITGNTATTDYGAIALPNANSKLTLKGNVQIKDNVQGKTNKIPANVYLRNVGSVATVTVDGLAPTAIIGVTVPADRLSANQMQIATCNASDDCADNFDSDLSLYSIRQEETAVYLTSDHKHNLCDDKNCTDHAVLEMKPWTNASSLPTSGNWFLATDVTLTNNCALNGTTLTLCLNGHTVKIEKQDTANNRIFRIDENVTLNITDCAATAGKLTGGKNSAIAFYDDDGDGISNSVLNLYNGEITGNTSDSAGGAVLLQKDATFNMYGGKITGNKVAPALKADGTPVNTLLSGGAVAALGAKTTFNMYGGEISGNEAQSVTYQKDGKNTTVGGNGGGIYIEGTANITGGKISGNTGAREGGAIRIKGGKVLLKNVEITGNTCGYASAIYIDNKAQLTVDSCVITGNVAINDFGAIYIPNTGSKLTLKGNVQIKDNVRGESKVAQNVYLRNDKTAQPIVHVENLADTAVIAVSVQEQRLQLGMLQVAECAKNENCASKFISDSVQFSFVQEGTKVNVKQEHGHCICGSGNCKDHEQVQMLPWTASNRLPSSGNWYLTTDVTIKQNTVVADATLNLCLNGHTIKVESETSVGARVYYIQNNAELNLTDCAKEQGKLTGGQGGAILFLNKAENAVFNMYGGIITGNTNSTGVGGAVLVQGKGVFNMYGGKITENHVVTTLVKNADGSIAVDSNGNQRYAYGYGGGLASTSDDVVINMYGGEISNNKAVPVTYKKADGTEALGGGEGGGLYIKGTFNMYGGKICGNTSERTIAGIRLNGAKTVFNMYGGEISGNVSQSSAAGVVIESRATMNMFGGKITGNKSVNGNGGGVFVSTNSFFNMKGGEISKNVSGGNGAGVYTAKNSTTVITGGKITGNKTEKSCGGGIAMLGENAKMTISGVTISGNTARYGGAIWLRDGTQLQINSCKITGNSSEEQGGALYASANSTVTINGGTLSYNSAKFGGAFYASAAKVKMNGTTIVGNKAVERHGGAGVIARTQVNKQWVLSTVTLNNCYVANNEAKGPGGGIVVEGQGDTLNINGGTFTQNKALGGDGGAVYASSKTILNITGAKIEKNTAQARAGALRVADYATATVKDTVFDGNVAAMQGGAICHWNASGLYENVTMSNNTSGEMGGGIVIRGNSLWSTDLYSGATLRNCTIKDNEAVIGGGVGMNGLMKGVLENCTLSGNHATQNGGGIIIGPSAEGTLTNCVISDNSADDRGGGIHLHCRLVMDNCQITNNYAVGNGGGICTVKCVTVDFLFKDTGAFLNNVQVSGNRSDREGGGVYLFGGCNGFLTDVTITDNTSRAGASGLYAGYDLTAKNLTVTGNKGGDYAVKLAEANYDGASYQSGHKDMSGLVKITDNVGGDLYIPTQTVLVLSSELAEGSRIDVTLADGVISDRVLGMYNYEGGNLVYTLTPGMRSITDPEEAVAAPETPNEDTADQQAGENTMLYIGVAAFAVVVVAAVVILVLLNKKKKKAVETADTTQE